MQLTCRSKQRIIQHTAQDLPDPLVPCSQICLRYSSVKINGLPSRVYPNGNINCGCLWFCGNMIYSPFSQSDGEGRPPPPERLDNYFKPRLAQFPAPEQVCLPNPTRVYEALHL